MRRTAAAALAGLLALAPSATASADTLEPVDWDPSVQLGSAPNALRFGGTDRYATSLAITYALRSGGGFPYDSPDRTTATSWGAATCPSSVILVAGDTPADALAAAPLSDPTNRSNEPRLTRVASADPFFDPPGELDRVDTAAAPIIVTTSARAGARRLAPAAAVAVTDLRAGACDRAREAIIVGGPSAVPVAVESELVELGYEEVFRVGGANRFETAAQVAASLGTEAVPTGVDCVDEAVDDASARMGFYGNAVIEYRPRPDECELHGRAVVLADGSVGADALAAGWWTSYWQVPVLLVGADGSLPPATRSALQSIPIDTIVVLGGTGRVPESVVDEAASLASAVVGRFAGADRYGTSVELARAFGGWYPTGEGADFAGDRVCVAASSGSTIGWPDALAAGPWCGRMSALGAGRPSPARTFEPIGPDAPASPPTPPTHDAMPILLVPPTGTPRAALSLLETSFTPDDTWCTRSTAPECHRPGFAVAFGGTATVTDATLDAVSVSLAGGDPAQRARTPDLAEPFRTDLDLAPVFRRLPGPAGATACLERGGVSGGRWLATYGEAELLTFVTGVELATSGVVDDAGTSLPLCAPLGASGGGAMISTSTSGRGSTLHVFSDDPARRTAMTGQMVHGRPRQANGDTAVPGPARIVADWHFRDPARGLELLAGEATTAVEDADVRLFLTSRPGIPTTVVADITLLLADGTTLAGQATGEAVAGGTTWQLAGRFRLPGASGGFRATLDTLGTADGADDRLAWQVDATRP